MSNEDEAGNKILNAQYKHNDIDKMSTFKRLWRAFKGIPSVTRLYLYDYNFDRERYDMVQRLEKFRKTMKRHDFVQKEKDLLSQINE